MQDILKDVGQLTYFIREKKKNPDLPLSDEARKHLIHSIVEWTCRNFIWMSTTDCDDLFKQIKEYFPHENLTLYFRDKKTYGNYSGEFYNHFRARHDRLKEETGIRKNNTSGKKKVVLDLEKKDEDEELQPLPKTVEVIRQRLISRAEPWEEVLSDWKKTFESRRSEIKDRTLAVVLKRWPKFNHSRGSEMVTIFCSNAFI